MEAWVEEGASLSGGETQVATEAGPQPPSQEPAIQPLNRSRSSIGRSVDPQKLAKVLEYLLSPTDSVPPDLSSGPFPIMAEEEVGSAKETPVKGVPDPGVTESAPLTTEDPSFPQSGEEGSSLSSETNV